MPDRVLGRKPERRSELRECCSIIRAGIFLSHWASFGSRFQSVLLVRRADCQHGAAGRCAAERAEDDRNIER